MASQVVQKHQQSAAAYLRFAHDTAPGTRAGAHDNAGGWALAFCRTPHINS